MRPETRLESAVFQLTPTRTRILGPLRRPNFLFQPVVKSSLRIASELLQSNVNSCLFSTLIIMIYLSLLPIFSRCDLVVVANGRKEKIASGLLNPFVAHLKVAQEQIAKGGYSITLEPDPEIDVSWFTRGTVERFVRFVSTPEVLERVTTIESEILQIEDAIAIQGNDSLGLRSVENHNGKSVDCMEGQTLIAQLLRVLETRKTVLCKEQAMAFARAVAAGFDIDNLVYLITFAERFGASRLILLNKMSLDLSNDLCCLTDQRTSQHSGAPHEFFHGPYQSAYPPWAMHPSYSMQGMPYYPGMNPYYPPPYPPMDDTRYHHSEKRVSKKHSSDSKDPETSDDESDQSGSEREASYGHRSHKKDRRTGKKKPSVVVIRNINVTSKKNGSSEGESQTVSDEASEDSDDSHTKSRKKKKSSSSKMKDARKIILESADEYTKDEMSYVQDGDQGNWNVFQSFLLRADEKTKDNDADLFTNEKEPPPARRKESTSIDDSMLLAERDAAGANECNTIGFNIENGRIRLRQMLSGDELMMSGEGSGVPSDGIKEIEAGDARYRRGASDDFMIYEQEKSMDRGSSLDPIAEAQYKNPTLVEKNAHSMADESFMIPLRFATEENLGPETCTAIDIDVELPSTVQKISDAKAGCQLFYEPDELMPERGCEDISFGYDPAMDYNSQMQSQPTTMVEDAHAEESVLSNADEVKKPEKDKRLRSSQESLDKRRKDASVRRLSSSKGPMTDAQKRAQNLRAYKADLQKAKKEQEEEQIKRLERLKLERQKRIAARSSTSKASTTPQQPKVKPSPKVSPSTYKSSKFSDAEPASSSPLRKLPAKTTLETDPKKTAKANKLNDSANAVSNSTSSLTDMKEKIGRAESSSERLRKLAEPKTNGLTDHLLNSKLASVDHPRRRSMPQDTQTKKISAIMQLDQTKSATLPELKVKSPQAPAVVKNAIAAKEKKEASPGAEAPTTETADVKKSNSNISRMNSNDDSAVVEKTVVMLENEVVSIPPITLHSGRNAAKETSSDDRTEKPSPELEYTAIRGPPSPSPLILRDAESAVTSGPDDEGNSYEIASRHEYLSLCTQFQLRAMSFSVVLPAVTIPQQAQDLEFQKNLRCSLLVSAAATVVATAATADSGQIGQWETGVEAARATAVVVPRQLLVNSTHSAPDAMALLVLVRASRRPCSFFVRKSSLKQCRVTEELQLQTLYAAEQFSKRRWFTSGTNDVLNNSAKRSVGQQVRSSPPSEIQSPLVAAARK
ncbi:hypothetical protein BAE44_0004777 [Dichanthelium oligosanthes]|uniref:COP1-interacting protein-related n=1 Tax=Dichanthelium oligosanthes TaxID=888268 RepID=A0A1E5W9Y9_9POAL|nr:hypothetical protein BAE44_0004777 [Dichanthelium oligosanthes]